MAEQENGPVGETGLIERIGFRYQRLTGSERRIYDLLVEDPGRFALASITEVAARLQLSKTTLVRFANRAGFDGYASFKRALQEEVFLESSPAKKLEKVIRSAGTIDPRRLAQDDMGNIESMVAGFSAEDGDRLVKMILAAGEIFTLSWGISLHLAEIFGHRMRMIGIRCTTIRRRYGTLAEEVGLLQEGDLVLVFELPPYSREISETVKVLEENNVRLVLLSDSARCPLSPMVELAFYCPTRAAFFGNSLSGPLSWINLISSMVLYAKREHALALLASQERIFEDRRYYHR